MKHLPHKILLPACLLVAGAYCRAQSSFAFKTALPPVAETKFYAIPLPPKLLASCRNPDFSDIRITDSTGAPVPYILQADLPVLNASSFAPYPILSNTRKDSSTALVIGNVSGKALSQLLLVIKNASAYRTAVLSGSDNQSNWYVIDENIVLEQTASSIGDKFVQAISFPLSNYRFFKLTLRDKGLLPLNILQAGVYKNSASFGKFFPVPAGAITQKDSTDHYSYLRLQFNDSYRIDKLVLLVSRPALYKRSVQVYLNKPQQYEPVKEGMLSPDNNTLLLSVKTSGLLIKVYNADNPPLVIDSVAAFQASQQLVARLEKGEKYFLLTGDSTAGKPDYDLQFFKDSISLQLPELAAGAVTRITAAGALAQPESKHNKLILWFIIGMVLLILLILTRRMSKEVGKDQP